MSFCWLFQIKLLWLFQIGMSDFWHSEIIECHLHCVHVACRAHIQWDIISEQHKTYTISPDYYIQSAPLGVLFSPNLPLVKDEKSDNCSGKSTFSSSFTLIFIFRVLRLFGILGMNLLLKVQSCLHFYQMPPDSVYFFFSFSCHKLWSLIFHLYPETTILTLILHDRQLKFHKCAPRFPLKLTTNTKI